MRQVHFFKAKSRLGLRNRPFRQTATNAGAENGPDAIVTRSFASVCDTQQISVCNFSSPESIAPDTYNAVLAREYHAFKKEINTSLKPGSTQVVVGGDHSVTFASVLALLERVPDPKKLGYIQFDSHTDIHLASTSPSGNFHGMYVRALIDTFDVPEIETLTKYRLLPENMLYVGNLDMEPEEAGYVSSRKIAHISGVEVRTRRIYAASRLRRFIKRFDHLHITFDIDCLDKKDAPATGIPAENGMYFSEVRPLLKELAKHPSISVDLVEVNPHAPGARKTIQCAREILATLLANPLEQELKEGLVALSAEKEILELPRVSRI